MSSLERLGEAGWLPDVRSEESLPGRGVKPAPRRPALGEWQRAYFGFCWQWRCNRRNRRLISRFAGLRGACRLKKKCTLTFVV